MRRAGSHQNNNKTEWLKKKEENSYLIANVNVHPRLEVVKDLFQVPCSGGSQVTGIAVRLQKKERRQERTLINTTS